MLSAVLTPLNALLQPMLARVRLPTIMTIGGRDTLLAYATNSAPAVLLRAGRRVFSEGENVSEYRPTTERIRARQLGRRSPERASQ